MAKDKNKPVRQRKPINGTRLLLAIILGAYLIVQCFNAFKDAKPTFGTLTYNELMTSIDEGKVDSINVTKQQDHCTVKMKDGTVYDIVNPHSDTFVEDIMKRGGNISIQKSTIGESITTIVVSLPIILLLALFAVFITNTAIGGSTKMFTILKAKDNNVTFDSVKGLTETKKEVQFAVEQIKNWKTLEDLGARPCKGILFYGPPGTGKTMIAKAIANEAGVPFISASGSDFGEMFAGVGAARVRSLWSLAMQNAPCIIFIDEIDCLGKRRKGGSAVETDSNQTLNCLLQRMDGLNKTNGVMVIAATNRKGDLDEALLRPGRFDRHYYIGAPSSKQDRDEMVEFYLKDKLLKKDAITVEEASKLMTGLTGAEIEESLNEAVFISLREGRNGVIKLSDVDEAVMKLHTSGVKQEHTSEQDYKFTAIHEAGHTVMSLLLNIDISKVSIVPYSSGAGGMTVRDLDKTFDQKLKLKSDLEKDIMVLLAGMISEEISFGEHTQGCSQDLEQVTGIIYNMVTSYGHGETLFNENVLMQNGISHLLEGSIVQECNEMLGMYKSKAYQMLENNYEYVTALSNWLQAEQTLVQPTLKKIEDYMKTSANTEEEKSESAS